MYSKNHYCYYCYYIKPYTMCRSKSMAQQYGGERALLKKERTRSLQTLSVIFPYL